MVVHKKYSHLNYKTAKGWHVHWVYHDPEFINDLNGVVKNDPSKSAEYLCQKYAITLDDIHNFLLDVDSQHPPNHSIRGIEHDRNTRLLTIKFTESVTRDDYMAAWKFIQWYKHERLDIKSTTKRKPPDDPQLIYAVFKARKQGLTFRQIFGQYQQGKLDYYEDRPTNGFPSEDKLDRYYNKYKPDR